MLSKKMLIVVLLLTGQRWLGFSCES